MLNIEKTKEYFLITVPETIKIEGRAIDKAIFVNGKQLSPERSLKVRNHSPDGFNWGYGGSGPAQTSLAILLEFFETDKACRLYQLFKDYVISSSVTCPLGKDFAIDVRLRSTVEAMIEQNKALQIHE